MRGYACGTGLDRRGSPHVVALPATDLELVASTLTLVRAAVGRLRNASEPTVFSAAPMHAHPLVAHLPSAPSSCTRCLARIGPASAAGAFSADSSSFSACASLPESGGGNRLMKCVICDGFECCLNCFRRPAGQAVAEPGAAVLPALGMRPLGLPLAARPPQALLAPPLPLVLSAARSLSPAAAAEGLSRRLLWCASRGLARGLSEALRAGADPSAADELSLTPLHWAARNGHAAVISALVAADVALDVRDRRGYTPLHYAAAAGHDSAVRALLFYGAEASVRTSAGDTPEMLAPADSRACAALKLVSIHSSPDGNFPIVSPLMPPLKKKPPHTF